MTATAEETTETTAGGVGRVARVTGPVVDVEFPVESMPELFNALKVDVTFGGDDEKVEGDENHTLTLEVAQHLGDNLVRAISMQRRARSSARRHSAAAGAAARTARSPTNARNWPCSPTVPPASSPHPAARVRPRCCRATARRPCVRRAAAG